MLTVIEKVFYKDSETKLTSNAIVKMCGWKHVICQGVQLSGDQVVAMIRDTRSTAKCPCCGKRSKSVHSYYIRTVSDLPLHGRELSVKAEVRRFRCPNSKCGRKTFVAQIEGLTDRYSRRTQELTKHLETILVEVPATVGARQSSASGIPISASTALRVVHNINPMIDYGAIRHICIDDFAFRKGQSYRTLIVDADTRFPVEVVNSRDEGDVAKALRKYRRVSLVSRDRAGAFSKAIRKARPHAKQVADRFHLVMNCGEHVESAMKHNMQTIKKEVERYTATPPATRACSLYCPPTMEDIELFKKVKELRAKGWSLDSISAEVGVGRRRVTDLCNSESPHGKKIFTPKMILPYISIIDKSIKEGKGYRDIRKSILESGGTISINALSLGMKKLYPNYHPRQGTVKTAEHNMACAKKIENRNMRLLSSGRMHIYLANPEYGVNKKTGECSEEHILAEKLIASSETLLQLRDFHVSFRNILSGGSVEKLDEWIEKYSKAKNNDLASFINSIRRDIIPVKNAIRYSISNGLIEGTNNKIKAVKRSMYGRASDHLLWIKMYQAALQT